MTAQQLKNSILQMAVQGKLVPQDPNDEPASVLLERIRAEKEKMIKEGRIKREKNPSVIFRGADNTPYEKVGDTVTPLEVPFEIPESWEWVRFNSLIVLISGTSYQKNDVCKSGVRILRGGNIQNYKLNLEVDDVFLPDTYIDDEKNIRLGDTILVASTGSKAVIGKPAYIDKMYEKTQIGAFLRIARPIYTAIADYIALIFQTEYYREHIRHSVQGTNINNIKAEHIENLLIPLPPLQEQNRILSELDVIEPFIVKYGIVGTQLDTLNCVFPEALKKSILQQAVQGKLVPQDPADEPAEILLERIQAEKQRLIREGKIKKDKHESVIFRRDNSHYELVDGVERCIDEEIPFEIPESWRYIRLNDIGEYRKGPFGSSLTKSMFVPKGVNTIKVYEQKNAIQKDYTLGTYYIKRDYYEEKMKGFTVYPGDIIVSCAGTIGETYIMPENIELGIINQALMRMRIFAPINIEYFLLYFDYVIKHQACENSKGSAIKNIPPFEVFKQIILPLPPIEEQDRIVEKIQDLFSICEQL